MRRLLIVFVSYLLCSVGFGGILYKTPSNTLVWEENFSDAFHLMDNNNYISSWVGGVRNDRYTLWSWDGPIVDVVVDKLSSRVYTVGELGVHSYISPSSYFLDNAPFRYDVYAHKLTTGGVKEWPLSPMTRTNTNDTLLSWANGESRYPSACVDSSGNLYVVYSDNRSGWRIFVSKISPSGVVQWEVAVANTANYQAKPVYYGGFVYVVYYIADNIRIAKINETNGNIVADVQINTSSGNNYYPDVDIGPDNYLYVVWLNNTGGTFNIRAQRIDPTTMNRVSWGGNTSDKTVNMYTNYSNANYWYSGEETVSAVIDGYNLYVAFKLYHRNLAKSKVFLQKVNFSGGNFVVVWTNNISAWGTNDVMVGNGTDEGTYSADAYPDLVVVGNSVFVVWINHGPTENDHCFLQRIDKNSGQMLWERDVNLTYRAWVAHHTRIASDGAFLYVISANPERRLAKLDQFGNVIWVNDLLLNERLYNGFATFRVKNLIYPDIVTGFVPLSAKVTASFAENPSGALALFLLSPETNSSGASTNYTSFTNGQSGNFINQKGNVFMYIILSNRVNEGTNRIVITNLKVEFTEYYFSDGMVGKLPSGSDMSGLNVIRGTDNYNLGQLVDDYTYNDGVSSAKGFFYFVNNATSAREIRIRGDRDNPPNWIVKYFLCTNNGSEWIVAQEITASVTNLGFVTNLQPYAGGNSNIVAIRVHLTPSVNLSSGDNYVVKGYVDTRLPNGSWVLSDVIGFRGIVSSAKPDLRISKDGSNYLGNDIINSDGSDQTIELRMNVGVEKLGFFYVKNTGGNDNIKIQGTGGDGWWKVEYLTNGQDVTSSIVNGSFTINLPYGAEFGPIEVRFSPTNSSVPINVPKNIVIKGISSIDPTKEDVIKFVIRPVITKVEMVVRKANDSTWVGGGMFSQDYSQRISNRIDNGLTNVYEVSITNLGSYNEEIIVRASNRSFATQWKVEYLFGGFDITSYITNQGFVLSNLSPSNIGSNITVRIISPSSYPSGANEVMGVFFVGIGDSDTNTISKRDTVAIYDRLVSTRVDCIASSSLYGTNGYNFVTSDPSAQQLYGYVVSNIVYTIVLSNPSPSDFEFNVRITNANPVQWKISVSNASADITGSVTNPSGWTTSVIPSGEVLSLSLVVHSTNETTGFGANLGDTNRVVIILRSPLKADVMDVFSVFSEKVLPPDLLVRKTNEPLYRGHNMFTTNVHTPEQLVFNSYQNTDSDYKEGLFRVKNHRPVPENVVIKVSEVHRDNIWEYKIYRYVGNNIDNPDFSNPSDWYEVTTDVTNVSGITNSVTNGSDVLYRISGKPISATNNNDKLALKFEVFGTSTKLRDVGTYGITFGVGIPDIYAYDGSGRGIRNTNYTVSTTNIFDKALGDIIALYVSNQNSDIGGAFTLRGDGNKEQWEIRYYSSEGDDITSSVTGVGFSSIFEPSEVKTFYVKIKAIPGSTYSFGQMTNFDVSVENDQGNRDTIRLVSIITDRSIPDVFTLSSWSNVYETTPSAQLLPVYIGKGDSVTNTLYLGNWRNSLETNYLYISPPSVDDFSIKIERFSNNSWIDITPEATNLGIKYYLTLSNSVVTARIIMKVDSNTTLPWNTLQDLDIQLESQGKLKVDRGKFRYILADMGRPDIFVVLDGVTNGYSVYESGTPVVQILNTEIEKRVTNILDIMLGNGRSKPEVMKVWASGYQYAEFKLKYYISTNGLDWNDVTHSITNTNGINVGVSENSNVLLRLEAFLTVASTNNIDDVLETSVRLYSWAGL
ncbi:MAG: hypothetical protein ABDH28_05020, partial [Brevinematia bacterium]